MPPGILTHIARCFALSSASLFGGLERASQGHAGNGGRVMRIGTIGIGMVGVAGIAACLYMAEHGYEWWQIALMALFTYCIIDAEVQ